MRVPNLTHGSLFMVGAYVGVAALRSGAPFPLALLAAGGAAAAIGATFEAAVLRRVAGDENAQVLATIGLPFLVGDGVLMVWGATLIALRRHMRCRRRCKCSAQCFPPTASGCWR